MKKLFSNTAFNVGVIILIGGLVLWISMSIGDPEVILSTVLSANPFYIFLAFLFVLLWQLLVGFCLMVLTHITHPEYKLREGYLNAFIAALFHDLTPSASGGQIAQFYVFRKQGVRSGDAGSILWMEFIIYQTSLTILSLVLIILKFGFFYSEYSNLFIFVLLGFLINSVIIFFIYGLAKFKRVHNWIKTKGVKIGYRLHLVKDPDKAIDSIEIQLEKFRTESEKLKHNKKVILICAVLCILRLLVYYSIPYLVFLALGAELNFDLLVNSVAMGSFVAITSGMIPIPGASGGTEAIFVLMFGNLFGSSITTGAMLLWRFLTYYLVMIIGALCLAYLKIRKD